MVWSRRTLAAIAMATLLGRLRAVGAHDAGWRRSVAATEPRRRPGRQARRLASIPTWWRGQLGALKHPDQHEFALSSAARWLDTPLQVTVALITATDVAISHIHASFQPGDGLQLQSERNFDVNDPRRRRGRLSRSSLWCRSRRAY